MLSRRLLRIKVFKSLYSHRVSGRDRVDASLAEYRKSVDKCYELYELLLGIPPIVADYARERIDLGKKKLRPTPEDLNPNTRFADNPVIAELASLNTFVGLGDNRQEVAKEIYELMLCSHSYKNYMAGAGNDRSFVEKFYSEYFEDNEAFEALLETESIFWADDLNYALIQAIRTIKATPVELLPQWKAEEDRKFGEGLFLNAVQGMEGYLALVDKLSEHWDLERIAMSDKLLLVLAIAELVSCPSVPVKVTLDETIEISKHFSTPQSNVFINGILHKAIEELTAEGRIKKEGRGLLDGTAERLEEEAISN